MAQVADMKALQSYIDGDPFVVNSVELGGYRTVVNVPMLKEGHVGRCHQHLPPGSPAIHR